MTEETRTIEALLRLLDDEDRAVGEAVVRRLAALGAPAERALRAAATTDDARARVRARAALERVRRASLETEAARLSGASFPDLLEAALLVARFVDPDADASRCLAEIDRLAAALRARLAGVADSAAIARAIGAFFGEEHGFRGDEARYYEPANSSLVRALETRRGLPITLSVLYVLVGARAGADVRPVAIPSHFLVRVGAPALDLLLDPFRGGLSVGAVDCAAFLASRGVAFVPGTLAEPSSRAIAVRMAGNLVVAFERAHDPAKARDAARLREILTGGSAATPGNEARSRP